VDQFRRMNKNEHFNENLLMMKLTVRILLICLILAVAALACVNGGDGNGSSTNSSNSVNRISVYGADATATYGAEQFELQLTAIANPGP
jgi:hypothetical protein